VATPATVDGSGYLTSGATSSGESVELNRPFMYQYQTNTPPTDLLATNISQWLYADNADGNWAYDSGLLSVDTDYETYYNVSMAGGVAHWFGLSYIATEFLWGNSAGNDIQVNAGQTESLLPYGYLPDYLETSQPKLETVEYDFWNASPFYGYDLPILPGNPNFLPSAVVPLIIESVGSPVQIAGYAKMTLNNGNPGIYGYLGQYFETNAYEIDTNGYITTNATDMIMPIGTFFAMQPGPVALTTMPDLDTGQRGTGVVYAVSLNVDKNHDGTMDLAWNGQDATSQS